MSVNAWGVPGVLAMLVAWTAAAVVLRTAADRNLNRLLALLLFVEGLWVGNSLGLVFFVDSPAVARALALLGTSASVAAPFIYLAFLGTALPARITSPLRSRVVLWALPVLACTAVAGVLLVPERFISELYSPGWAAWNYRLVDLGEFSTQFQGLVYLYGFVAAILVLASSPCCDLVRRQALWFAIAFGIRDVLLGASLLLYPVARPLPLWGDLLYNPFEGIAYLLYVVLLTYGVLQAQLFDIELRLRIALRRSTVFAIIAATFFLAAELLEELIPVEGMLPGLLAAGLIVLSLRPLQVFAQKIVDRILPRSQPGSDELLGRKFEVYRAALEGALQDGVITDREEQILSRLRQELDIEDSFDLRLQRELTGRKA